MKDSQFNEHLYQLQSNEISRGMYQCSILARKLIAYGAVRIREKEVDQTPFWYSGRMCIYLPVAEFKISALLKALNLSLCGQNYELVKKAVTELRHAGIDLIDDENEYLGYNWFQSIHYNKRKDSIEMCFSQEIGWALYNLSDGFTAMNLNTIGEFKSFYAFRFYEIALSWKGNKGRNGNPKGSWFFQMTEKEIRDTFKIETDKYQGRTDNFVKKVINEPIKELNDLNFDFSIEVEKLKRGRETLSYRFVCYEKKPRLEISKKDSDELKKQKLEVISEEDKIENLKRKHKKDWERLFEEEMKQESLFPEQKEFFAEKNAEKRLLDLFGK